MKQISNKEAIVMFEARIAEARKDQAENTRLAELNRHDPLFYQTYLQLAKSYDAMAKQDEEVVLRLRENPSLVIFQ